MTDLLTPLLAPMLLGLDWMDPEWLLDQFGDQMFWVSVIIVFVECGLLFFSAMALAAMIRSARAEHRSATRWMFVSGLSVVGGRWGVDGAPLGG